MSRTNPSAASAKSRKTILYATIAVVIIGIVVAVGFASRTSVVPENATKAVGQSKLKVGDTAPAFAIATNAGNFDLAGVSTPVLLEVFAPWCPHCQKEAPILNDLATKYAGKLAIVAVSGDAVDYDHNTAESESNVHVFADQYQTRYPIAFDRELKVAALYLRKGFPSVYVIDKSKRIRFEQEGEIPEADLVKAINSAL
ncbi:MAG: TlpA family protein disulfide reductase [Candidatus Eremiobacteraeota bacterium]|nr:TlpA family protein disulfide reductase [Candidatus Eremiobacteraeota bacterium]